MKRYSIMVMEYDREVELLQCDNGAEAIAKALTKKSMGRHRIPKYKSVRVVDNEEKPAP